MSAISEALAALDKSADAEIARVAAKQDDLQQQLTTALGNATAQGDIDLANQIQAKLDVIDLDNPATLKSLKSQKK